MSLMGGLPGRRPEAVRPLPGGAPDPVGVFGRDDTILWAWEQLSAGTSLLLNEPRRFGKTALLLRMCHFPSPEAHAVILSFQGVATRAEMAGRALGGIAGHRALGDRVKGKAASFLNRVSGVGPITLHPSLAEDPIDSLERAVAEIDATLGDDELLVLAWDEIPDMVESIAAQEGKPAAVQALAAMRRLRERSERVRWILTGSVGFHHVLPLVGADSTVLNELQNLPLGPLDEAWSRWLAESLLLGITDLPRPEAVDALTSVSGGIPYLLHLVAARLRDQRRSPINAESIEDAFEGCVEDLDESHGVTHFLTRIGKYYGDEGGAARFVLDTLLHGGMTREDLSSMASEEGLALGEGEEFRSLLELLRTDHYLTRSPEPLPVYAWRYPVLARIWRQRRR